MTAVRFGAFMCPQLARVVLKFREVKLSDGCSVGEGQTSQIDICGDH